MSGRARGAWVRVVIACLPALAGSGCAHVSSLQVPAAAAQVELTATPFFAQERYQCGPAALATVLVAAGVDTDAAALVPEVYLPGRKGSLAPELLGAVRRRGLLPYVLAPDPAALVAELDGGRPALVLQNFGSTSRPAWHFAVVIGYERDAERFILRSGTTRRQTLAARRFLATWRRADGFAFIVLRPGDLPAADDAGRYLQAVADLEATGQAGAARLAYEAAVQRWPQQPLAWLGLGNARFAAEERRGAEAALRRAVELDAGLVAARNNLALLLAGRGCRDAALAEIRVAARDAAGTAMAAAVEDSAHEIEAAPQRETPTDCPPESGP